MGKKIVPQPMEGKELIEFNRILDGKPVSDVELVARFISASKLTRIQQMIREVEWLDGVKRTMIEDGTTLTHRVCPRCHGQAHVSCGGRRSPARAWCDTEECGFAIVE